MRLLVGIGTRRATFCPGCRYQSSYTFPPFGISVLMLFVRWVWNGKGVGGEALGNEGCVIWQQDHTGHLVEIMYALNLLGCQVTASCRWRFASLLLCSGEVFPALISSLCLLIRTKGSQN